MCENKKLNKPQYNVTQLFDWRTDLNKKHLYLILSYGTGKSLTVKVKVYVYKGAQKFFRLPAILDRILDFQVLALAATQLLKVEVQHGCQSLHQRL